MNQKVNEIGRHVLHATPTPTSNPYSLQTDGCKTLADPDILTN
jgi:hypothetical protein